MARMGSTDRKEILDQSDRPPGGRANRGHSRASRAAYYRRDCHIIYSIGQEECLYPPRRVTKRGGSSHILYMIVRRNVSECVYPLGELSTTGDIIIALEVRS